MQVPPTNDSEFSSLPTPSASQEPGWTTKPVNKNGEDTSNPNERWYHPETGRLLQKGITQVFKENDVLPTPRGRDWKNQAANEQTALGRMERGYGLDIAETVALLRTPAASEAERGHQPEEKAKARGDQVTLSGQINYLPTPNTMDDLPARDESKIDRSKGGFSNVRETVVRPGFGRFEPAIRRWEQITGNEAPEPTKPDGKDGNPRLSSHFTEWMMGLEPGWITGVGLSRKDELKACGNGVVPQQAKLALTILLDRVGGTIE